MQNFDYIWFEKINQWAGVWSQLDQIAIFFAKYLGYILVVSLVLFLFQNRKYWSMLVLALTSALVARWGMVELIRFIWPRSRPFVENKVNLLLERVDQYAFPSGHAAFFFALSTIIFLYNKKAGLGFFLASFLICIFRVFSGVHWPSDILAGATVGIFSGLVVTELFKRWKKLKFNF